MKNFEKLFNIEGRVVVITGATGLLGRKHVEVVAAHGGIPIILDIHKHDVDTFSEEINERYNLNTIGIPVDITNEEMVRSSSQYIIKKYGKIDALVNNAANNPQFEKHDKCNFSRLENFLLEDWVNDISVGLTGSFLCSKYYGTEISKNVNGGVIVNISSDLAIISPDQRLYKEDNLADNLQPVKPVTYSVVKSGIIGLTRYLATYWTDKHVRCNAICPGGVENGQPDSFLSLVSSRIPMNRLATVDEYQGTLIWMLSDASSYLNGSIVVVDGGRTSW